MVQGKDMIEWEVYKNLKERDLRKEGIFIGEGRYIVQRMIETGCQVLSLLCHPGCAAEFTGLSSNNIPVIEKTKEEMHQITGFKFHRGVLAAARRPEILDLDTLLEDLPSRAAVAVLPSVSEPENAGSIIRSAAAFSIEGIITGPGCIDLLSRKAIRCSMGAVFTIPRVSFSRHISAINTLHGHGFSIIGTSPSLDGESLNGEPLDSFRFPGKTAVVFGHESGGLPPPWDRECDTYLTIPVSTTVDSLNVGVSAGIIFYALAAARKKWTHEQ
jgi:RNA methyltransferase, TrmH family